MSNRTRHILIIVFSLLLAAVTLASYVMGRKMEKSIVCNNLNVIIKDSTENNFVHPENIKAYLDREYGTYIGTAADSIDLARIESIIDKKSAVYKSEAYITTDGTLNIALTQRRPIVRFQSPDGGFYADSYGYLFPLQNSYSSHVQIIDGDIPFHISRGEQYEIKDVKAREWFDRTINLLNYLENSKLWKGKIVQIHVEKGGELILIPREGKEKFYFGQPVSIEDKMRKMEDYYTHILPEKGAYSKVDLRFKKQIVCK